MKQNNRERRQPKGKEDVVLSVENLSTYFELEEGTVKAVDGISFNVKEGETVGIVGESGSGKSVTARSILNLIDDPGEIKSGEIRFRGENLLEKSQRELKQIRGNEISMIFQSPMDSLNPVFSVGWQISRVIREHRDVSKKQAREETLDIMRTVGIPDPESRIDNYPHQFSGGMRQRILIAMAISCNPSILIADEPTTALDVTIEGQIFDLLKDLQDEYDMSIILITHDLGVVAGVCDRVNTMYAGEIIEKAETRDIFEDPRHPYTRGLLRSIPRLDVDLDRLEAISGEPPDPSNLPSGCSFHPRCEHATQTCTKVNPELRETDEYQEVACIHAEGYGDVDPTQEREPDERIGQQQGDAP